MDAAVTFDDLHLVAEDGRAVAVFTADRSLRSALADALSWELSRRFGAGALDEAESVLDMRASGALADRLDAFREVDARGPVRVHSDDVRLLLEAAAAYVVERDVEAYQPPEERDRIAVLVEVIDPLFDLAAELARADRVLGAGSL